MKTLEYKKPKKYVLVQIDISKENDLKIYATPNHPYYIIDNKLFISKNIDDTETLNQNIYECLGSVIDEFEEIKEAEWD